MLTEIDKDFYCSADSLKPDRYCKRESLEIPCELKTSCTCRHRKYPTPEQFKEEYGEEWTGAVYVLLPGIKEWATYDWETAKGFNQKVEPIVCACTPYSCPPIDFRLEEK